MLVYFKPTEFKGLFSNNFIKIHSQVLNIWLRILRSDTQLKLHIRGTQPRVAMGQQQQAFYCEKTKTSQSRFNHNQITLGR